MSKKFQIGTPLRKEYTVVNSDWLTGEDGLEVENTQALHFSAEGSKPKLLVQARIDNNSWVTLHVHEKSEHHVTVDVSRWERVRFSSTATGSVIRMVGYQPTSHDETLTTNMSERDHLIQVESQEILNNIHTELKKLNTYMSIITGENL